MYSVLPVQNKKSQPILQGIFLATDKIDHSQKVQSSFLLTKFINLKLKHWKEKGRQFFQLAGEDRIRDNGLKLHTER